MQENEVNGYNFLSIFILLRGWAEFLLLKTVMVVSVAIWKSIFCTAKDVYQ